MKGPVQILRWVWWGRWAKLMFRIDIWVLWQKNNMTRKCHNHRQQTNQWHPEEEIHKVKICCRSHWKHHNIRPFRVSLKYFQWAPSICFVERFQISQKAVCCISDKRKCREWNLSPPPSHTKKPLHLHFQTPRKSMFSKTYWLGEFEEWD